MPVYACFGCGEGQTVAEGLEVTESIGGERQCARAIQPRVDVWLGRKCATGLQESSKMVSQSCRAGGCQCAIRHWVDVCKWRWRGEGLQGSGEVVAQSCRAGRYQSAIQPWGDVWQRRKRMWNRIKKRQ